MSGEQGGSAVPAVRVRGLTKRFRLPRHRVWTIKERIRHPLKSLGHERLTALTDVSFEVQRGEFFAVIGRNGSGKSTLLRCLAGIYDADRGSVEVEGRLAPFIELGIGFQPVLAARDNVTVSGTLMGLRPQEARRRFPGVIGFAELEEFVDMPIANYSSGMQVRLAFATSVQVDADILLFDEVLAVGDALYRRKCLATFDRLLSTGHTIVFVSHSFEAIRRFADRVLLLDEGKVIALGEPEAVIEQYERRNRERERTLGARQGEPEPGDDAAGVSAPFGGEDGPRSGSASPEPGSLRRFADIALTLARMDFKVRYLDSVVGYAWALAQPILMFLVIYLIWTQVIAFDFETPHYELTLLLGIALFTFFSEGTGHALPSLVTKGAMLRKIAFPPLAVPVSSVLTSLFVYSLTLVVVLGFVVVSGIAPRTEWLQIVPLLLFLAAFTTGVAMLVAFAYVSIRDLAPMWVVVSRLLFFLTPVFYPIELAPEDLRQLLMLNPLAVVMVQARHALIDPSAPTAAAAAGGAGWLAIPVGLTAAVVATGLVLFRVRARRLSERI